MVCHSDDHQDGQERIGIDRDVSTQAGRYFEPHAIGQGDNGSDRCRHHDLRGACVGLDVLGGNQMTGLPACSNEPIRSIAPRSMSARGSLGCTTNRTHRSIPAPPTPAGASRLPRTVPYPTPASAAERPSPDPRARAPRSNRPGPGCSTRRTSLRRRSSGEGFHPIRPRSCLRRRPERCLHHFVSYPAKEESIGLVEVFHCVTMQVFVRGNCTMIAAPVQCDVDGIPKGSHYVSVPPIEG